MKKYLLGLLLFSQSVFAGLPPTTTKAIGDTSNQTTFNFLFPNFAVTRSGISTTFGINGVAGGGTGLGTLTSGNLILGNGTGLPNFLAPGTSGNVATSNGTTWVSSAAVAGNAIFAPPAVQYFNTGSGTFNEDYTFVISTGSATVGATYTNNSITYTVYSTVASAVQVVMSGSGAPTTSGTLTKTSGTGDSTITFSQVISPLYLIVELVGGGGGGGATGTSPGAATAGGSTTFGSSLLTGNGGALAGVGTGGVGGAITITSPAVQITGIPGGDGGSANNLTNGSGGIGGGSCFGGAGSGGYTVNSGVGAATDSGSGGGGAGSLAVGSSAAGGGAGGCIRALITSPSVTYPWSVGAAGARGTAGTGSGAAAGGNGANGHISVEVRFQ